ncbi:hypothetical protein FNV43_RR01766 [Rhamnella rubrinervis]|uniref:Bifunctional inhibitor/plant lipid transfer protein/seed storage helical domain-containing protein n=1 Tax=Rhamnella rubrinervis TaxID=2594499 RepID=A0A8K0HSZ6_9ROSA|nr:hypothetical protein FNV43_RR01766 [Rhamnella rubrinervis]
MPLPRLITVLAAATVLLAVPVFGQISTPCSASVLTTSFTPCMNYLTNSSGNGGSPTAECCNSLKSLSSSGMDCLCLIVTGSVPFQIPINRSVAISLPRACKMSGVPVQCKASGSPLPAPGPGSLGPSPSSGASPLSPGASPSASPTASSVPEGPKSPALAPESDTTPLLTPPSPTAGTGSGSGGSEAPTATPGLRPVLTPSAAMPSYPVSPSVLLFAFGFLAVKLF